MIPMRARDTAEQHRVATPLELFFDLFFVVAVGAAAAQLHHAIAENHLATGLVGYAIVFFAIYWAWLGYTWFASSYDTGDAFFRLMTLVVMAGIVILAAGVPKLFVQDFTLGVTGYVVMRVAMVIFWLRAASDDPARRTTALRYAIGTTVVQLFWVAFLLVPAEWKLPFFVIGAIGDMGMPLFAEQAGRTPWHPHHIAERYGLFTIIVMGENVLALVGAVSEGAYWLAGSALVVVFAIWWLYFDPPTPEILRSNRDAIPWGYGHLVILGSVAAIGAGVEVGFDPESHASVLVKSLAVAVPVALFVLTTWFLHIRPHGYGRRDDLCFVVAAVLVLLAAFTPVAVPLIAVIMALLVAATTLLRAPRTSYPHTAHP